MFTPSEAQTYRISTLAGRLTAGSSDGVGSAASFRSPWGVAADDSGAVFVADTENHTIRKINPSGEVTTIAGLAGRSGSNDGTGSIARFNYPEALVVDPNGDCYVSDSGNATIRKISPDGLVTTLAGKVGDRACIDGKGADARFGIPFGIAFDNEGNLVLADSGYARIRIVTTNGVVTTLRDATGNIANFYDADGVAVDKSGNIFVVGRSSHTVVKITPDGSMITFAGKLGMVSSQDGIGTAARFGSIAALAVDKDGTLFVADSSYHTIRKITSEAFVSTIAGAPNNFLEYADGVGAAAKFAEPIGIAGDRWGNIYIADAYNNMIRKGTPMFPALTQSTPSDGRSLITWPAWATNYVLETRSILSSAIGEWVPITKGVILGTNGVSYSVGMTNRMEFFRLRSQ